jgi:hypothetical protein
VIYLHLKNNLSKIEIFCLLVPYVGIVLKMDKFYSFKKVLGFGLMHGRQWVMKSTKVS